MALRQETRFALASQSAKGTAATTNFISGIMQASLLAHPDWVEQGADTLEHSGRARPTGQQGKPIRTGFNGVTFNARQFLYPNMLGYVLMGLGFEVSTAADTPVAGAYTHTFTIADADSLPWISVMQKIGAFERKARDGRITQATFDVGRNGATLSYNGLCLNEAEAAGTETVTEEAAAPMIGAGGTFTVTSSDITAATLDEPRSHQVQIQVSLEQEDQEATSLYLNDLAPTDWRLTGTLQGLVFSENIYKELNWGGTGGTAPVAAIPEAQLFYKWQSASVITGSTVYRVQFTLPTTQVMMRLADVEGGGKYVYDAQYRMMDLAAGTEPATVQLVNDTASYGGS